MKLFAAALLLTTASFAYAQTAQTVPPAQDQEAVDAARSAADKWLALVDAGQYKASWEQAGRAARMPVGAFQGRTLASSNYTTTLPGAPQGQYVVLQYTTRFADRANAVETVTPMLEADGTWRVSGYFLK